MQTTYVRLPAKHDFTIVHNSIITDKRLSAAARATHIYLISRPPEWKAWNKDIQEAMRYGRYTYLKVMQELREAGYQSLKKGGKEGGMVLTVYEVSESLKTALPHRESENPTVGKSDHKVSTDKSSKTDSNNNYWQRHEIQAEWLAFKKMRVQIKAPVNAVAETRLITKLKSLQSAGEDIAEVLNRSTENCWKGVYSYRCKENGKGKGYSKELSTPQSRNREAIKRHQREANDATLVVDA